MLILRALGKAEIVTPTDRLTPSQEMVFAAALFLLIERSKPVSRAMLAEMLWPDTQDVLRQHRFRQMLHQLKKRGFPVKADRDTVAIGTDDVTSDLDVLFVHNAGDVSRVETLQFLPGYSPACSREFSDWLDVKRREVSAAATRVLLNDIRAARGRGDWLRVERLALKCMDVDPFNEEAVLARAEASAMRGSKREAVSILDRYVAELGPGTADIKLPASLMRKRISERIPELQLSNRTERIFVGRESEMQMLTTLVEDTRAGKGRCCLLWGDAGIGKSRLAAELSRFAELQGVQVRRVACRRGDVHRPLSVFVEAVPLLREMRGALGCSPDTLADLQRLTRFDISGASRQHDDIDPQSIFELIRAAIFDLIDAVSEEQCLILVVEDVQWLDAASARILGQLADWASTRRVFLIFTSRTRGNLLLDACTRAGLATHHLLPLSSEAATSLVNEMFEATNETSDEEFVEWCREVGDGNPFFLHELVKQWIETKQRHAIPPSITTVIHERFSRLSSEATQLLQACSVLGEHSTLPRVEQMLEQEPYMILTALSELSRTSMLSEDRSASATSADFRLSPRHDLVSKVALDELDAHAKVFLHRRAGEVLEKDLGGETQDTSLLWACAHHWQKAGDEQRSLRLAITCAEHLLEMGLPKDAADAFKKAQGYCPSDSEKQRMLLDRRIFALQLANEWLEVRTAVEQSSGVFGTLTTPHDEHELIYYDACWRSSVNSGLLLKQILSCVFSDSNTSKHRVSAAGLALKAGSDVGEHDLLDRIYNTVKPLLYEDGVNQVDRAELELIYHCMRSDGTRLEGLVEDLVSVARATNNPNNLRSALLNGAYANQMYGEASQAEQLLIELYDVMVAHKLVKRAWETSLELVRFYLDVGNPIAARSWLNKFDHSKFILVTPNDKVQLAFAAAKLAVEERDVTEGLRQFKVLEEIPDKEQSQTRKTATLAVKVRLELLMSPPNSRFKDELIELERLHKLNCAIGRQDYEAYSVFLGWRALGEDKRAQAFVAAYLDRRIERNSPPAELLAAIDPKVDELQN